MDRRRFLSALVGVLGVPVVGCRDSGRQQGATGTITPSPTPITPAPAPTPPPTPSPSPTPPSTTEAAPSPSPQTTTASVELAVICRQAWRADQAGRLTRHDVRRLTLHHTAVALEDNRDAPARLRRHQEHHRSLGWPDIAYHLAVDRHGHVYELRSPEAAGDTGTDYDPAGHFLVVALGDYSRQQPTDPQLEAIARAFAWGAAVFGAASESLTGHRDHASTTCPGDALQRRIPDLRSRIGELTGAVARREVCGAEGDQLVAAIAAGDDTPLDA